MISSVSICIGQESQEGYEIYLEFDSQAWGWFANICHPSAPGSNPGNHVYGISKFEKPTPDY
jgi:hypothetical protein